VSAITVGIIAVVGFLLLAMLGLPLGFSFAIVGFIGLVLKQGLMPALSLLGEAPYSWTSSYVLCAIPLFVLMGQFAFHSGISGDLYASANKWLNRLPGGLAIATMLACTGFAACTGSSVASAATMGTIAFPEMERFGYDRRLSTGTIAAGGTLGILVPPSTIFIIYGVMTETSIAALFIAGILPGLMLSAMFCVLIFVMCKRSPQLGPPGEAFGWKERFASLTGVWGMLILFLLVMGGLYFGVFAPSEAGIIGAFGAFIMLLVRRVPKAVILTALIDSARITCYMLFILIGAMIFNTFFAVSGVPAAISEWVIGLSLPPMGILILIIILYIPLGMFIDSLGMILLTIPILFPVIKGLGFDPVWFGVVIVLMTELALLSPPVALNVYVVQGVTKAPFGVVARGIVPFAVVLLFGIAILIAFPKISLFLPGMMK
jgi:C4-dicarboxylate transporter DctM subunit